LFHPERDGRDLPPNPTKITWTSGSIVEVATAVYINHGGGWSFRLCPKTEESTEECFQHHALAFVGGAVLRFTNGTELQLPARRTADGQWSRNLIPGKIGQHQGSSLLLGAGVQLEYPMPFDGLTANTWDFSMVEHLHVPVDVPAGEYLLSWRWDCESSPQVWFSCADVIVSAADNLSV